MKAPNFQKRKVDTSSSQKITKQPRHETQAGQPFVDNKHPVVARKKQQPDQKPQKTHKMQRFYTSKEVDQSMITVKVSKTILYIKDLLNTLWQLKDSLEKQYDELLSGKFDTTRRRQINQLLATDFFRFRKTTLNSVLDEYLHVIQGCELLISKLTNNEKLSEKVLIKNQQDFVLFFKFFFSKPYTLINLPAVRKIIKLLWDQFLFSTLTVNAMMKNLQLWIYGIAAPLNPSMNKLHKYVTDRSEEVSKFVTHKSNSHVFIGVNDSDSLGLTPLMVAAISKNIKAIEKLIKNGADPYCCPLTTKSKITTQSVQNSKYGNKTMIKKQFGYKERRQPNVIEYLKEQKKLDWIAHIFCWQNFYNLKKFKKNTHLSDVLDLFPDCSFQLQWKQYRGMLCFKQLPSDMISVSKRDHCLRVDFHTNDLNQTNKKKGFYTLLLRAEPKEENKFYLISHNERTIRNVLEDKDIVSIKEKYSLMMKFGNIYQYDVSQMKCIYFPQEKRLSSTFQTYHQNCSSKASLPRFRNQQEYFNELINTDIISYSMLQKDELKAIIEEKAYKTDKQKFKYIESTCTVDIQWAEQDLKLHHLQLILELAQLAFPQSILLEKLSKTAKIYEDPVFSSLNFRNKLPMRCKWSVQGQINLQSEIKNLYYMKVDASVFNLEVRAKEMRFEEMEQGVELSHLQDTVFMDQLYSISASRFMGKSQLLLQLEDEEANRKFEQLQRFQGLWSADEDEEK